MNHSTASVLIIFLLILGVQHECYAQDEDNMIFGSVVDENGEPIEGVDIIMFDSNNQISIQNGRFNPDHYQNHPTAKTDKNGYWELHDPKTAYGVFLSNEEGYAFYQNGKYANDTNTKLTPWCKVKGKLNVFAGGNAGESINMNDMNSGMSNCYFYYHTRTNNNGEFKFDHVIERDFQVSHSVPEKRNQQNGMSYYASTARITATPGEEVQVSLLSMTSANPYMINSEVIIFLTGICIMIILIYMMRRYTVMSAE